VAKFVAMSEIMLLAGVGEIMHKAGHAKPEL
jgi:hypothetical protein